MYIILTAVSLSIGDMGAGGAAKLNNYAPESSRI